MRYYVNSHKLGAWISAAQLSDTTWFKPRKDLWSEFVRLLKTSGKDDGLVEITNDHFVTIKSFLMSRNEEMSDAKKLSFEKTLNSLSESAELVDVDEEDTDPFNPVYLNAPQGNHREGLEIAELKAQLRAMRTQVQELVDTAAALTRAGTKTRED